MNKEDLDKLFQEKFMDFQQAPDERVWTSIEHSLDQRRKKRRVIPLWWKLGGVAALIALALLVINPFESPEASDSVITDVEQKEDPGQKEDLQESSPEQKDELFDKQEAVAEQEESQSSPSGIDQEILTTGKDSGGLAASGEKSGDERGEAAVGKTQEGAVAGIATRREIDEQTPKKLLAEENVAVAATPNKDLQKDVPQPDINGAAETETIDPVNTQDPYKNAETAIAQQEDEAEKEDNSAKKSIFDEIEKQEEEKVLAKQSKESKWSVGPSVAPVYFNSFGEGSPIHSSFVSNSKSGNVNLSYGVGVSYDISKKLKIRSGIHKVDYGYDTNDIAFSSSLVASTSSEITNINYTNTSRNLVVENRNQPEVPQEFDANDIIAPSPSRNGRMVQEFGYVEVPMELNYALLDKKLNIDIIGGFSSLFLVNNSVTLESEGTATEMGEANNLNDVNFSTNVGLGINYELTDKMKIHLEPIFKYQMNTFSDSEGNFEPYSLGVYTGMSFRF